MNAIQCGLYISKCRIDQTTTHVGITYGRMCAALMGGYHDHYTIVVNGLCIDQIGVCLNNAKSEEVAKKLINLYPDNMYAQLILAKSEKDITNQIEKLKEIEAKHPKYARITF